MESLPPDQTLALASGMADGSFLRQFSADRMAFAENPPIELPPPPSSASLYTLHVSLRETSPTVWRRLRVRSDLRLPQLHDVLQVAMGWTDTHLHRFVPGAEQHGPYFLIEADLDEGETGTPEDEVRLDQVLRECGDELVYDYDFGDGWSHRVLLETVEQLPVEDPDDPEPGSWCVAGAGACPPEDCGGVHRYLEIADWVRADYDPARVPDGGDDAEAEELREWLPDGFDPDAFDIEETNEALAMAARGPWFAEVGWDLPVPVVELLAAMREPGRSETVARLAHPTWCEPVLLDVNDAAAMVRPWRVLLDQVGDGLDLTAAGYLPPRVVQAVFDQLGLEDYWIGKGNREDLTPPVAAVREQAQRCGLLRKAKGRVAPTRRARALGEDPVGLWWHIVGWIPTQTRDEIDRHAGWLALIGTGVGEHGEALYAGVGRCLDAIGWRHQDGSRSRPGEHVGAAAPTLHVLDAMTATTAGGIIARKPEGVAHPQRTLIARAALTHHTE